MDMSLAPDGHRVAVGVLEAGRYVIRIIDLARPASDDVLGLPGSNRYAAWNPDGHRLASRAIQNGQYDAHLTDLASNAPPVPFVVTDFDEWIDDWPDGGSALLVQSTTDGQYPLYRVDPSRLERRVRIFDHTVGRLRASPDGLWIAGILERSGRSDVFVRSATGEGQPERVSHQGAQAVAWSPKTHELFYARPPDIFVVAYHEEGGRFRVDKPRLFATAEGSDPITFFAVGTDRRVLTDLFVQKLPPPELRVVFGLDRLLDAKLRR
jgi:Tol biopolymer transport system component